MVGPSAVFTQRNLSLIISAIWVLVESHIVMFLHLFGLEVETKKAISMFCVLFKFYLVRLRSVWLFILSFLFPISLVVTIYRTTAVVSLKISMFCSVVSYKWILVIWLLIKERVVQLILFWAHSVELIWLSVGSVYQYTSLSPKFKISGAFSFGTLTYISRCWQCDAL